MRKEQPLLVIGSPPCTPFSQLQTLNPNTPEKAKKWEDGVAHMKFVLELYELQVREGRAFLHEHPANATSWQLAEVKNMAKKQGVLVIESDQCMFGLKTWGDNRSKMVPAKKPTKFMTNSRALGNELQRKCDAKHEHQPLVDGRASMAARYPEGLCKAICRGIVKLKMEVNLGVRSVAEIPKESRPWRACTKGRQRDLEELHERDECHIPIQPLFRLTRARPGKDVSEALAWDDLTGMRLDAGKVIEAREKEVKYVQNMKVWTKIPRRMAQARGALGRHCAVTSAVAIEGRHGGVRSREELPAGGRWRAWE